MFRKTILLLLALHLILLTKGFSLNGNSPSTAFTSLSDSRSVPNSGVYFFNINGTAFSSYVNNDGFVQVAIDFGNGTSDLPQVSSLDQFDPGILTPSILASLTEIETVRIMHSGNQLDVSTNNPTIISNIQSNTTLHAGSPDNGINNDWTGTNSGKITVDSSCNSSNGSLLHQNIGHLCGKQDGFHWIPKNGIQRIAYNLGEIADAESLSIWVQGGSPVTQNCGVSIDSDNDGVDDEYDQCPNEDDTLIGSVCDDGNSCTVNDTWSTSCDCVGTKLNDADNDGVCDANDGCPNFNDLIDIDSDGLPYCMDTCVDVNMNGICDDTESNFTVSDLEIFFSHERGFYNQGFSLEILTNDPNATIKYTVGNNSPSVSSGNVYSNSININSQSVIKVIAYNNSDTTELVTHSYIFIDDVINNSINSEIKNDANWGGMIETALLDLPTISISGAAEITSTDPAIAALETGVSFEYIDNKKDDHIQVNAGIHAFGAHSLENLDKKGYRIKFDSIYGPKNLKYPIFDGYDEDVKAVESFDKLNLRTGQDSWLYDQKGVKNFFSSKFMDDMMRENGVLSPHCRHVHVYMNGEYWGMYTLREQFDDNMISEYEDIDNENYDYLSDTEANSNNFLDGVLKDGDGIFWQTVVASSNNYDTWKNMVSEESFFDVVMFYMVFFIEGEWKAVGSSLSEEGFIFNTNDADFMFIRGDIGQNRVNLTQANGPNSMFANLYNSGDENFFWDFADRVQCHYESGGIFTKASLDNRINELASQIELGMIPESGRWGGSGENPDKWNNEIERIKNEFTGSQPAYAFQYMKDFGLFPNLDQVVFSYSGCANGITEDIILSNPNNSGNIYYTLNGEDVRLENGALNPAAILYNGPIVLNAGVTQIYARVYNPSQANSIDKWSAFCNPKTYYTDQDYSNVVINEIHYNPADSIYLNSNTNLIDTVDGRNFEFIEILNTGNTPVNLYGSRFSKGVDLEIDEVLIIQPDEFLVFAEDSFWFQQKYGFAPDGVFAGKLSNGGEKINLKNSFGYFIDTIRYDDITPWDVIPDAGEYSLALIDATTDNSLPTNWSAQSIFTTPKQANQFCTPMQNIASVANVSCFGANDGFIANNITGGTAPLNYVWNNGQNTEVASNLSSGQHILTITDAFNCTRIDSFAISEPMQLQISDPQINHASSATLNDGSIDVTIIGGSQPYSYLWTNGANTQDLDNVLSGIYGISITDANGCLLSLNNIEVGNNCLSNIVHNGQGQHLTGVYQVSEYIESNGIIDVNENVSFKAGQYVALSNYFEVKAGAEFEAMIDGCN